MSAPPSPSASAAVRSSICGAAGRRGAPAPVAARHAGQRLPCSKGLSTVCALQLVERGLVDLDAPITRLWPAFAAAGQEAITLRQVSRIAPGCRRCRAAARRRDAGLAAHDQAHSRRRRRGGCRARRTGIHVNTFGFLIGEVARRAGAMTLGTWLRTRVAAPLAADVHIGLPAAEHQRVAEFLWPAGARPRSPESFADDDERMRWNTYWNPPGLSGDGWVNSARWRSAELPSTNGHATARGLRACTRRLPPAATSTASTSSPPLLQAAAQEHSNGPDRVLQRRRASASASSSPSPNAPRPQPRRLRPLRYRRFSRLLRSRGRRRLRVRNERPRPQVAEPAQPCAGCGYALLVSELLRLLRIKPCTRIKRFLIRPNHGSRGFSHPCNPWLVPSRCSRVRPRSRGVWRRRPDHQLQQRGDRRGAAVQRRGRPVQSPRSGRVAGAHRHHQQHAHRRLGRRRGVLQRPLRR